MGFRSIQLCGLAGLVCVLALPLHAATSNNWYDSIQQATHLFDKVSPLAQMADQLSYFTNVFTAVGYAAVMIVAVRKVARARNGEESMGWVASTMMTIALMAFAPTLSDALFNAADEVAKESKYSPADAINTCWNAVLVILPSSDSPMSQVLSDASQTDVSKPTQISNDNASFTKLAWSWMKIAWSTMTNALGNITSAFRSVVNSTFLVVTLSVPTMALIFSMFAIELGMLVRSLVYECMQIFLPMMIACLSFAPMRAAATNFIIRFITVAFWPVAWALGNAIACSLLTSVIAWVVSICIQVASALKVSPTNVGLLAAAAGFMNWTLLFTVVAAVSLCAALVLASAIAAPRALNALVMSGSTFIGDQLGEAMRHFNTQGGGAQGGGGWIAATSHGRILSDALTRILSGTASTGSGLASRMGDNGGAAPATLARSGGKAVELAAINDDLAIGLGVRDTNGVKSMLETNSSMLPVQSMAGLEGRGRLNPRAFKNSGAAERL
jgi:hypothetical protein